MSRQVLLLLLLVSAAFSREVVDRIAAVVDKDVILESDLRQAGDEIKSRPEYAKYNPVQLRQMILDKMIDDRVIMAKARFDTLDASESEIKERVAEQVQQIAQSQHTNELGLAKMIRAQMGMSLEDYKNNFLTKQIREQLAQQRIRQRYVGFNQPSQVQVEEFFKTYGDSLPVDKDVWKISRIEFKITPDSLLLDSVYKLATSVLRKIQSGQSFERLAEEYSQDSSSRADGGDLGFYKRGALDPRYESVAFQKENGQVVERPLLTKEGYHLIKLLDKRDNEVRTAHILFRVIPTAADTARARALAMSIRDSIVKGSTFESMASRYSDDKLTAVKGGSLGWLPASQLDNLYIAQLTTLQSGSFGDPMLIGENWHLIRLEGHEAEHKLNLVDDRERIAQMCQQYQSNQKLKGLVEKWRKEVHIEIR